MRQLRLFQEVERTRLDKLLDLVSEPIGFLNNVIMLTTDEFVTRFYDAFWVRLGPTEANLATARAALVIGILGFMLFFLGELYDAVMEFRRPLKVSPTLRPVEGPSSADLLMRINMWFVISFAAAWIAWHVLASAFMPFAYHIAQFRPN